MFKIATINNISVAGLERFPREQYEVASGLADPDALLVRSTSLHEVEFLESLKAIGRAGAGVNNIPVDRLTALGIPVFNAPGANANAVKELVLAGMLMAARNLPQAWSFVQNLQGDDRQLHQQAEAGKKQFVGFELPGRTLGVVGLGAIGVLVANAAIGLGMKVLGYDPTITVQSAWKLSSDVQQALSVDDLLAHSDFVTFHVPLVDSTRNMVNRERLALMPDGAVVLNFSRDGIVDEVAVKEALESGKLHAYVCDFPGNQLKQTAGCITLPHLGASTREAEENCAVMVAEQVREYLEHGNIRNSVNFPEIELPRNGGFRLAVINANVPNMLGQISTDLAEAGLNIIDMLNRSRGDVALTLVDLDQEPDDATCQRIAGIEGVLSVRRLGQAKR